MMTLVNKLRITDVTCYWFSQKTEGNILFVTVTTQKLCSINLGNQPLEILPWDDDIWCVSHALWKPFIMLGCYLGIRHFFLWAEARILFLISWFPKSEGLSRSFIRLYRQTPLLKYPFHGDSQTTFTFLFHFHPLFYFSHH